MHAAPTNPIIASRPARPPRGTRVRAASAASVAAGLAWALSMGLVGLWVLAGGATPVRAGLGAALLSGGQLVFLIMVADRAFPDAPRVFTRTVLGVLAGVCALSCVAAAGALVSGSGIFA